MMKLSCKSRSRRASPLPFARWSATVMIVLRVPLFSRVFVFSCLLLLLECCSLARQVVDEFLKVPGAKVFTVTKHKVTYHDVDAGPDPASENASPETETESSTPVVEEKDASLTETGVGEDSEASETAVEDGAAAAAELKDGAVPAAEAEVKVEVKRVRVRAVTELERVVFLSRERILVLACPAGPRSPGLVKSNHHLTELQKMTFMKRDPTLVTLHYLARQGGLEGVGGAGSPATKRNVYRFDLDDKEAFIRIMRGALQRFQA